MGTKGDGNIVNELSMRPITCFIVVATIKPPFRISPMRRGFLGVIFIITSKQKMKF